jgi:hypothetical protein
MLVHDGLGEHSFARNEFQRFGIARGFEFGDEVRQCRSGFGVVAPIASGSRRAG